MNRNRLAQLFVLAAALNFVGCGGVAQRAGGDGKASAAATPAAGAASPAPAAVAVSTPADNAPAANAPGANASAGTAPAQQNASNASESRGSGNARPAKMPPPRIGSGGNDLFLFTQARAAVDADPELKAANLIIEVKEGVVTLGGTVASAALKVKAQELAAAAGPKAVRNQIRVAAGK